LYNWLVQQTTSVEREPKFQAPAPAIQYCLGSGSIAIVPVVIGCRGFSVLLSSTLSTKEVNVSKPKTAARSSPADIRVMYETEKEEKDLLQKALDEEGQKRISECRALSDEVESFRGKLERKQESYLQVQEEKEKLYVELQWVWRQQIHVSTCVALLPNNSAGDVTAVFIILVSFKVFQGTCA